MIVEAFDPEAPPVIPPVTVGADQLYVVPVGITLLPPLTGVILKPVPLQVEAVWVETDGVGFTVTLNVFMAMGSVSLCLFIVHVTVYVLAVLEFVGVTVAFIAPVKPDTEAGEILPL